MTFSKDKNLDFFLEYIINWLLPESSSFYSEFRKKISSKIILGEGRWGKGDFLFGKLGDAIDTTEGMKPVVAFGEINFQNEDLEFVISVSIHEPNNDGIIELQISPDFFDFIYLGFALPTLEQFNNSIFGDFKIVKKWTYSYWQPNQNCPAYATELRIVDITNSEIFLAFSKELKSIWAYDTLAKNNVIIPLTAYYNTLMLHKEITTPSRVLNPKTLFNELHLYSDLDLKNAFVLYNNEKKKIPLNRFEANKQAATNNNLLSKFKNFLDKKK